MQELDEMDIPTKNDLRNNFKKFRRTIICKRCHGLKFQKKVFSYN